MTSSVLLQLAYLIFPLGMAFAAASDLLTMTIPNRLSLALIAGFGLVLALHPLPAALIFSHLGAGAIILVIGFSCFALGWIGGGDAKIAAVAGLWLGLGHMHEFIAFSALFGGVLTLAMLSFRRFPLPAALARQVWATRLHAADQGVPYGIALAAGALIVYPYTVWAGLIAG